MRMPISNHELKDGQRLMVLDYDNRSHHNYSYVETLSLNQDRIYINLESCLNEEAYKRLTKTHNKQFRDCLYDG